MEPVPPDNLPSAPAIERQKRCVEVVTVPVKDIGPLKKAGLGVVSWLLGSTLTWAMHWAIRVEGTYFELHRPRGKGGRPRLRTSAWTKDKEKDIITVVPIGSTTLSDGEIVAISEPYFSEKTGSMFYSLYVNNCQLFVHFSLEKIAPTPLPPAAGGGTQPPQGLPPLLRDTISVMLGVLIYFVAYPFLLLYIRYLRWRGCDQARLVAYAALFVSATTMLWPMVAVNASQMQQIVISVFERESLVLAAYSTLVTAVMSGAFFAFPVLLTFPVARKRASGSWDVTTRMKQNNEGGQGEGEAKVKVAVPLLATAVGVCIGLAIWAMVAMPYLVRGIGGFLWKRLSFRSPGALWRSLWGVLLMPLFEEDRTTETDNKEGPSVGDGSPSRTAAGSSQPCDPSSSAATGVL